MKNGTFLDFSYAPLLRRFDHRLGVAMPAAPGSSFDVYGTLGHHYIILIINHNDHKWLINGYYL